MHPSSQNNQIQHPYIQRQTQAYTDERHRQTATRIYAAYAHTIDENFPVSSSTKAASVCERVHDFMPEIIIIMIQQRQWRGLAQKQSNAEPIHCLFIFIWELVNNMWVYAWGVGESGMKTCFMCQQSTNKRLSTSAVQVQITWQVTIRWAFNFVVNRKLAS